jgi:hypothetical protein
MLNSKFGTEKGGRMGLFNSRRPEASHPVEPTSQIPVTQIDLSKRYDVYCTDVGHDRVYENVRFVAIRTFDRISQFNSGLISGFLEMGIRSSPKVAKNRAAA